MDLGSLSIDRVPRSPSGRIPQWVIDEVLGLTPGILTPHPEKLMSTPPPPRRPLLPRHELRRHLRRFSLLIVVVAVTVVAVAAIPSQVHSATAGAPHMHAPSPGLEESAQRLEPAPVAPTPASDLFRVKYRQADAVAPVTWSPCRPIHFVVRPDNQPAGGQAMLSEAIAAVSVASGLRFVDDGSTDEGPTERREPFQPIRYGDRWAPVLITWATADEFPEIGSDYVGFAAPVTVVGGDGREVAVSGWVTLDALALASIERAQGATAARAIILHELGHLLGLGHIDDPSQLMYPRVQSSVTSFQAGDLTGLALMGSGSCAPNV